MMGPRPSTATTLCILGALLGCPGTGAGTEQRKDNTPQAMRPPAADILGTGDEVEVRVFGEPDLSGRHKVRSDGTIALPLAGRVAIGGMTPELAAESIRSTLRNGFLNDPEVSVTVLAFNSKKFYVTGAVGHQGVFPYVENVTMLEAIIMAGGFTPGASKNSVVVTRNAGGATVRFEVPLEDISQGKAKNVPVMPGDIIYVPTSML